jgi:hypothetical protein
MNGADASIASIAQMKAPRLRGVRGQDGACSTSEGYPESRAEMRDLRNTTP